MIGSSFRWLVPLAVVGLAPVAQADPAPAAHFMPADAFRLKGVADVAISPDGRTIAYLATDTDIMIDGRRTAIHLLDAETGRDSVLAADASAPRWSPDGQAIHVGYGDRGVERIGRFDLAGGFSKTVANVDGDFTLSRDSVIAYAAARADRPADVAITSLQDATRRLTNRNAALLAGKTLGSVRALAVRSSLDGKAVGAWLTLPPEYKQGRRYPTILAIHGGPYGFDTPTWSTTDQLYAAAGYAVIHANYRGSTSYGFAFADRIARDFPNPAYVDLMSAVDAAVAQGVADPARLFITGGSAGGQLTARSVGSTDRFRAAVAEKPVINAISMALTSDQYPGAHTAYGAQPWEAHERYWASSPLSLVGRVRTPTMLVVGDEDYRTPVTEAQQFYNALMLRGIPTAFVLVPGAGHASIGRKPSQLVAEVDLTLDWFARHGGGPGLAK